MGELASLPARVPVWLWPILPRPPSLTIPEGTCEGWLFLSCLLSCVEGETVW